MFDVSFVAEHSRKLRATKKMVLFIIGAPILPGRAPLNLDPIGSDLCQEVLDPAAVPATRLGSP